MAESLLKYVSKRRNRSSDSSTDGKVDSPAMKKVKNTSAPESSPPREEHGEHNDDSDLVLTALELTDDLNGTLKCILEKLKKLDTIENAVKKIEGSLDKLERRTGILEEFEKTAREDIENLKSNHMLIEKKQDGDKKALDKKIKGIEGKIAELKVKEGEIDQTLKDLNTKDLYLEAYSRRENIKFNNIPEFPSPRNGLEDTEEVLRSFLEKQLGYHDASSVEIQRVHRLGRKKEDGGARPILARFLRFKDCEKILGLGSRLRGTNFQMFKDLPQELVTRRREQMDTFKTAKRNNIPVSFSKSQPDKLYVRDIVPGFKTDHSMVTLNLSLHSNPRGKGFWKLNTSLLSEIRYIEEIKTTINITVNQYKDDTTVNPALLWEMIKLKVREKTISYAAYKSATTKKQEEALESEIALLENQLDNAENNNPLYHIVAERITTLKKDLEKIIEYRTKGAIIRSKSLWYNEGEKNSKYFLNLEKRHCKHGTISQLKVSDSDFVTTDKAILSECTDFYRNLYTSKIPDCFQSSVFAKVNTTSLTQEEQTLCEGKLTQKECFEALKNMNPDKTPGTDGFPAEFYKVFWKDIAPFLISALNYAFDSGCLSVSQRRGVIKLIPKKDAELYFIKNWRPITLLNTDYKIAAKSIANRIKRVLPNLINHDQTGFLKGRFIGENIRLIDCIIQYATEKNIPGLLLFIDFEKAFDSLEWSFIYDTLRTFGFGASLTNWVKTLYNNTESCVLNNGWASDFFEIQRGVRQGCPLSPYLFILSAEILAIAIRNNTNIKGISVNDEEIKISQYADDTTLILDGSHESLFSSLAMLDEFSKVSGLRLNDKKTEALWIGASIGNDKIVLPGKELKWPKNKVKTLGLWISTDPELSVSLNYSEKLEKVKEMLGCWKYRRLTLLGT
ncbi:hypothetical protein ACROYT_G033060 [Oculina patagonica]